MDGALFFNDGSQLQEPLVSVLGGEDIKAKMKAR